MPHRPRRPLLAAGPAPDADPSERSPAPGSTFSRHGLGSRLATKRADRAHQPLDPLVVAGPWVLLGGAVYAVGKRVAKLRRGRRR